MAFSLPIPEPLRKQGWKVKIRDRERLEPPHVTIMRGKRAWRLGLRAGDFLDVEPDPDDLPAELVEEVRRSLPLLRQEWDARYSENPVQSPEDEDE